MTIRFVLNGEGVEAGDIDPTSTVLDLLRYRLRLTGSKEGCAEGDCGACTVLLGELEGGSVAWRAVNSCILFAPMIDGRALITVEGLTKGGSLHPIQQAMVELHGSQCGFCTPGIVMSLYGRCIGAAGTRDMATQDVLAGNLCRCTGYGPILAAAEAVPTADQDDKSVTAALQALSSEPPLEIGYRDPSTGRTHRWFSPKSLEELARLRVEHPEARIIAGATDVGLWVTKQYREVEEVIWVGDVEDFRSVREDGHGLTIAAGARYSDAESALAALHPDLGELIRRIGGTQIRNAGTIGGNIANGSPIGDMPPALIALGATLLIQRGSGVRELPLEDYFLDYGRQDLGPDEFVAGIRVPRPNPDLLVKVVKLSKRFDSDISALCGAFAIRLEAGVVASARIAFGGMAAIPKRASACEAALVGRPWSEETVESAALALGEDFSPISDVRGSAAYRSRAAANLLRRVWLATQAGEEAGSVLTYG